jgi:transcriptional regulator with XRE-family HTH domain
MASNTKMGGTSSGEISEEAKAFGAYLRNLRKAKGLNQADLAKIVEITGGYYGFFEQGRQIPSLKIINRLAEVLDDDYLEMAMMAGYDKFEAIKKEMHRKSDLVDGGDDKRVDDQHEDGTDEGAELTNVAGTQENSEPANVEGSDLSALALGSELSGERLDWAMACISQDPTYKLAAHFTQGVSTVNIKALVIQLYQAQTGRQLLTPSEFEKLNAIVHGSN